MTVFRRFSHKIVIIDFISHRCHRQGFRDKFCQKKSSNFAAKKLLHESTFFQIIFSAFDHHSLLKNNATNLFLRIKKMTRHWSCYRGFFGFEPLTQWYPGKVVRGAANYWILHHFSSKILLENSYLTMQGCYEPKKVGKHCSNVPLSIPMSLQKM